MKYLLFFFLLLFHLVSNANSSKTDSLKTLLQNTGNNEKLEILQKITRQYLFQSCDSCIKYGTLAVNLAHELQDVRQEATAFKTMGYSYYRVGDYDQSIRYYERALISFKEENHFLDAAIITNFIGDAYSKKSDYPKAIDYFVAAEKSCDTLIENDSIQTSVKRLYAILYTNLGLLYYRLDSLQKPLVYYDKALQYASEINDSTRITASYSNIGMVYRKQEKYDLAKEKYFQALSISRKIGNKDYEISILNNIANIYWQTDKTDSALMYYQNAKNIIGEVGDKYNLSLVNRNIAQTYYELGNNSMALKYILAALDISRQIGAREDTYHNYKLLSEIYEKQGKGNLALKSYKQFAILKDSVKGQETREKIADIQIKYESEKKEKENVLLRQDIEIKEMAIDHKNTLLTVFVIVTSAIVTLLIIIFILFRQKSKTLSALVRQNLKSLEIEKKLEKNIAGLPNRISSDNTNQNDQFQELNLRLEKFLVEEKPYLWADINMEEFCKKLNTNRTYLSKLINDQYNYSFNDFLCEYRIREARNLLADPSNNYISIEGIGETAGFKTNSHFHKKFKSYVGLTPKQFREKALKSRQ